MVEPQIEITYDHRTLSYLRTVKRGNTVFSARSDDGVTWPLMEMPRSLREQYRLSLGLAKAWLESPLIIKR